MAAFMSEFKIKSNQNKDAADLLVKYKKYAPTIHCAYYSYFQMGLHIIRHISHKSLEDIVKEYRLGKGPKSSHLAVKQELISIIRSKDYLSLKNFYSWYAMLYQKRIDSDYNFSAVIEDDAEKAIKLSSDLNEILVKIEKLPK